MERIINLREFCFFAIADMYLWVNRHPLKPPGGMPFGTFPTGDRHYVYCLN